VHVNQVVSALIADIIRWAVIVIIVKVVTLEIGKYQLPANWPVKVMNKKILDV